MANYETSVLSGFQADEFISAFDSAIGTETETTQHDKGEFTVVCFELSSSEVKKARRIENRILNNYEGV